MLGSFKIHKNYNCDIQIVSLSMYVCIIFNQLKEQICGHIFFDHFFRCNYLLINESQIKFSPCVLQFEKCPWVGGAFLKCGDKFDYCLLLGPLF